MENNLIKTKKKDDPSGSRTLLRLHRALEYIAEFLGHLEALEDETYLGQVSKDAYEKTLMKYHPWIVQVGGIKYLHVHSHNTYVHNCYRKLPSLPWECCLPRRG